MLNLSQNYGNLGGVFVAYTKTICRHAHREPLRAVLLSAEGEQCHEAPAMTILKMIMDRKDDGVTYNCETDLNGNIPESVMIRASCSRHFWWFGHEWKPWTECYDSEKGYFDLYPYDNPFGTDFSAGIAMTTLVDHQTGEVLKDKEGRNLAVYGYLKWHLLAKEAGRLAEEGFAFDFYSDGTPCTKLAHVGPKGCLRQNPNTGKWKAAWN